MGAIGGLLGFGGGSAGTAFDASNNPLQPGQIQGAYSGVSSSLQQQQALLQALQAQNGIANQSQVYGQLQGIASGAVNPAQAQFARNTQQNVANQAALMAGQRGASANAGLIARQAAQQGAGIQQQAVGQQAAQQAQNQIAAINAAGNLATTQAGQQIGATQTATQANLANQGQVLGAAGQYNATQAGLANTQLQGQQGTIGGILSGVGTAFGLAGGGEIVKMADGGGIGWTDTPSASGSQGMQNFGSNPGAQQLQSGVSSSFGKFLKSIKSSSGSLQDSAPGAIAGAGNNFATAGNNFGANPAPGAVENFGANPMSSPEMGSQFATAAPSLGFAKGGMPRDFRSGGKVSASSEKERAVKKGNDYANDKIPAVLSEHEIVLPRSVTMSKDPVGDAAKFVAGVVAKRKARK